jgi:hypothetical protein
VLSSNTRVPTVALLQPQADRRAATRRKSQQASPARLSAGEALSARLGRVYDVSARGLGLLTSWPAEVGAVFEVELMTPSARTISVRARVRHATPRGNGNWLIGCELLKPLSERQIGLLC